eukprot:Blabericola_migrator_1__932@NODE_1231_length_5037_cov_88_565795_g834_i0_p2_GENE_NODE_1231_length_5037_cov_88_565795_g834_i0NODE_1231_length_5037_cov_88_565795_g834_i0_p2_ORF_typecomplete_len634_score52_22SET/PF00856_28/0_0011TPR_MalT/PF17874_1/0_028TPR_MalT/PF17874_1/10Capsid_VP7/PF17071_5/2_6e03Capsid_VP7/PF17071_5/0_0096Fis1_TPR_C/PF14853_6/7_2e02Fis1_TPR_C/PF14853_6/0_35TPR_8/PF13181_6/82TPR_8/PF13181_6/2_8TPR_8/PF13181_6/3_9e03TPR_12/PF13424_6/2TPR_12/PF13424_6/50ANAPC5/PF12862_7/1_2e02ANAPC
MNLLQCIWQTRLWSPPKRLKRNDTFGPCLRPLDELQLINIDRLTVGKTHSKHVLVVRVLLQPYKRETDLIFPSVEDIQGGRAILVVPYLAPPSCYPMSALWKSGNVLAIKAPLCVTQPCPLSEKQGISVISVYSPSNVHNLPPREPLVPWQWRGRSRAWERNVNHLSTWFSLACYHLQHGRYHSALLEAKDALQKLEFALAEDKSDASLRAHAIKFYRLAAHAACKFQDYRLAKQYIQEALKLSQDDSELQQMCGSIISRQAEKTLGSYDWLTIARLALGGHDLKIDRASYTSNVRLHRNKAEESGLFATRDLDPGDLIMCEKAFAITKGPLDDPNEAQEEVCAQVMHLLQHNPPYYTEFHTIYGGNKFPPRDLVDGMPVIDSAMWVHSSILTENPTPYITRQRDEGVLAAFWMMAGKFKLDCIGNAHAVILGNLMVVHASQHIAKDQEIRLQRTHDDFTCEGECRWCIAEAKAGCCFEIEEAIRDLCTRLKDREALTAEIVKEADALRWAYREALTNPIYHDLPKRGILTLNKLLAPWTLRRDHPQVVVNALQELNDHGYQLLWEPQTGLYVRYSCHCVATTVAATAAARLSLMHEIRGQHAAARQMVELAKEIFKVSTGTLHEFVETMELD